LKQDKLEEEINFLQLELNNRPNIKQIKLYQERIKEMEKTLHRVHNQQPTPLVEPKQQPNGYTTVTSLYKLFKVSNDQELLNVAFKVNKAIRGLPVLESFCNDVCREVFE